MFNYSDFQAGMLSKFQFANGINRNEYRQGVLNAAQARIFEQDLNKDGVLTFDEFVSANEYANKKADAFNGRPASDLGENCRDYALTQQAKMRMQAEDFKALDVNQDGVLDQRELANEISLMDLLGGKKDGVVSQKGLDNLWGRKNPAEIADLLRENYLRFNAKNLGMPWDKFGDGYSRNIGEICNPYNLNNPMLQSIRNPYAQQLRSPIAPQALNPAARIYNPIAQAYNPIGYRPTAQSFCPNQLPVQRQLAYMNGYLNGSQNMMNQFMNIIRMMFMQNYAY